MQIFPTHLSEFVVALFGEGDKFGFVAFVIGVFGLLLGAEQAALRFDVFPGPEAHFFLSSLPLFFRKKVAQKWHVVVLVEDGGKGIHFFDTHKHVQKFIYLASPFSELLAAIFHLISFTGMNPTSSIKKSQLVNLLLRVPDERLREVDAFIQFVLSQSTVASPAPASLGGIWCGKGFEELGDIQEEIDQLRRKSGKDILDKY